MRAEVFARYLSGETQISIAKQMNLQQAEVSRIVSNHAPLSRSKKRARGELNGRSKLSDSQVRSIRQIYKNDNVSQRELARQFDVSQSEISLIIRGKIRYDEVDSKTVD